MAKGTKELKEALVYGFVVAAIVLQEAKDGVQIGKDSLAVIEKLGSDENLAKLKAALEGAGEIVDEAKDTGLWEGIDLGRFILAEVKKLAV